VTLKEELAEGDGPVIEAETVPDQGDILEPAQGDETEPTAKPERVTRIQLPTKTRHHTAIM
jgi:hypothetical protein